MAASSCRGSTPVLLAGTVNRSRVTLAGAVSVTADGETVTSEQSSWTAEIREVYDDRLVLDSELPSEAGGRMMTVNRAPVLSTYRVENLEGDVVGVSPGTWIGTWPCRPLRRRIRHNIRLSRYISAG